ncbi:hypothetical protein BV337_00497 [Pseudomonas syringae pv. actinidiae]|nr:hypothetical protein BV327_01163 [Pseudomonas syringae pv. actinidiae]OSS32662.1 hypothetical protein BV337_00497 [Pseudomonas syringae pv. actinidiae]
MMVPSSLWRRVPPDSALLVICCAWGGKAKSLDWPVELRYGGVRIFRGAHYVGFLLHAVR